MLSIKEQCPSNERTKHQYDRSLTTAGGFLGVGRNRAFLVGTAVSGPAAEQSHRLFAATFFFELELIQQHYCG
jgi:hypothetical protein